MSSDTQGMAPSLVLEHAWMLHGEFVWLNFSCLLMCELLQSPNRPCLKQEKLQQIRQHEEEQQVNYLFQRRDIIWC